MRRYLGWDKIDLLLLWSGTEDLVLVGKQHYILRVLSLVVFVLFVFGSSRDSSCYCLFCSSVAFVSILLWLLLLFDSFRSNAGKFLLLFCLL